MLVFWLAAASLAAWVALLLLPSRPWVIRERLDLPAGAAEPAEAAGAADLGQVCVLIPARNEAPAIPATLSALALQGRNLQVILIDDESTDGTADAARAATAALAGAFDFELLAGRPLPDGWAGKLWALDQGLARVGREYCLLLDAEIELERSVVAALLARAEADGRALVSVMAKLRCECFWERLLVPPFIFFFRLIYPFAAVNSPRRRTAAAAGGCVLIRTSVLREIGGFGAFRDALIDDCTLAARVKRAGYAIWLGMSEQVRSRRAYPDLASFRRMVARTAFTQLRYSYSLLALVVALMLLVFVAPGIAVATSQAPAVRALGAAALLAMAVAYLPTLRFYRLPALWALSLPFAGLLYLAMTIESAVNYAHGVRAEWKGRNYGVGGS